MLDFDRLQTPQADGDILIEPAPAEWVRLISENVRRSKTRSFTIAGEPADVVAKEARAALIDDVVIAGGHQPAFVHPGVWAKHVVLHHAAEQLGARALDFVVDNDAPRSASLPVPMVGAGGLVSTREIAFAGGPAGSAYEGRPALGGSDVERIRGELQQSLRERYAHSPMEAYLTGFAGAVAPRDAVGQHLAGRTAIDRPLEAEVAAARVSDAFSGLFLADLLLNPEPFARAYNQALARYRKDHDVRSPDRPLPDLQRQEERCETALWIYQPLHARRRLWVRRRGDRVELWADQEQVGTLAARELARAPDGTLAALRPWVIRPRALTLTLWARLFACDFFVHGIGGAKYDRITDDIMRLHYGVEPPAYACVTATLRLPLPRFRVTAQDVRRARRERRDWQFNPQRYLPEAPAELIEARRRLIGEATRLREVGADRMERRENYLALRAVNARLAQADPGRERRLTLEIERLEQELGSDLVAGSREYFYGLQPGERLAELAARIRGVW